MIPCDLPRIVIAGTAGGVGKTTVTLGLALAFRARGIVVQAFKKGPDFIDTAWLSLAALRQTRNLDARLFRNSGVIGVFDLHAPRDGISIIEGSRGLFDGGDAAGTHSTASLARLLSAPIVLLVSAAKATRTVAAAVLGCMRLEPGTPIVAVILNQVAGDRHLRTASSAIQNATGLPVIGALPRWDVPAIRTQPTGLLGPDSYTAIDNVFQYVERLVCNSIDVDKVLSLANAAPPWSGSASEPRQLTSTLGEGRTTVGVLRDSAFSFYYPENLEALEALGARIVPISPLRDHRLPPVDVLYAGGGAPELYAKELSCNYSIMGEIRAALACGLPVYAESGGMLYMCRRLTVGDSVFPMVGALPIDISIESRPVGHGYLEVEVVGDTPFYSKNSILVGHEFHYSRIVDGLNGVTPAFRTRRGPGLDGNGGEGLVSGRVLGTFLHVHALGTAEWAKGMLRAALAHRCAG